MSISYINSLRLLNRSLNQFYPVGSLISNNVIGSQTVRWRKPRWVPKAPSKLYLVTCRKRLPPDEAKELLRLYRNYRCFQRMTLHHLFQEDQIQEESGKLSMQAIEKEEEEHEQLMEYNRQENERMAQQRNERYEKVKEEMIKTMLEHKAREEEKELADIEAAYQRLKETQELVKLFIEPENLEQAIINAIDNPVDFNFAIDLEGRKYEGRMTQPHKVDLSTLPVFSVKDEGLTNQF